MNRPQRIVVYRLGSLGDTVVALPCLHRIAESFPEAERIMLTNLPVSAKAAPLEAILGGSGLVHRFMAYPVGTRSFGTLSRLAAELRALRAEVLVYLTPPRGLPAAWRDVLFFRLCGFRRIVGAPLAADLQHPRRGADGTLERECERLARCLQTLGPIDLDRAGAWDLRLSDAERAEAQRWLAPLNGGPRIAINMGGKLASNDWGVQRWTQLLQRLAAGFGTHALMIVGGPEDAARADAVTAGWPAPVLNLCGRVGPRVSAAAMAGSVLFIGHDSGPLHLAAAMQVDCVGLFGNNNEPCKWHPRGAGHRIIHEMRGVPAIEVDTVVQAVRQRLGTA